MERYRFVEGHALYFLTFSVVEWLPVFIAEEPCRIVTESLNFCHESKSLRINAFVIMPTHIHLIAFDEAFDSERLHKALTDFRKFTGRKLADYCARHVLAAFTDVFRKQAGEDRTRRFWQPTRHPEAIYSRDFWQEKVDYIHNNPIKAGLVHRVDHWRFSSAGHWSTDTNRTESDVLLSTIEW